MLSLKRIGPLTAIFGLCLALGSLNAVAQESHGFKYNNLVVSPFVNTEYIYDSNVDYSKNNVKGDSILRLNPGVDLTYNGNDWGLTGSGWYSYDRYADQDYLDAQSYGERLQFFRESPSGWRFVLGESYVKSSQNDSLLENNQGLWRDRDTLSINSALSYQLSERSSLTLSGMYSDLNYDRVPGKYYDLYGWQEWSVGLEYAYKITKKTNVLLDGSYQNYSSDGAVGSVNSSSTGYTLMAGLGSAATKRITYRALTGINWFEYGNDDQMSGWTYSLDSSWVINKKLALTVAGSSYFQPSEREQNQAMQVYALSTGLTYRPMQKLTTRFDVAYRREENQYAASSTLGEVTDDRLTSRLSADYELMKYVSVYTSFEYQKLISDDDNYDFNRYRISLGMRFRY